MIVQMKMTWGPPVCPPGMEGMKWSNDESLKPSLINDTPEKRLAAIAACQQAFAFPDGSGSALPHAKAPWEEMSSDVAQGKLAKCGFGQLYCKLNADRSVEEFGDIVCDVRSLGGLDVRPGFEKLGAAAYFKRSGSGSDCDGGPWEITAIDWCHEDRLVLPDDPLWEHVKWAWRCSINMRITAVEHLVHTHWIMSNAVASSLRQSLGPTHPVRRCLHVNIFNTANVNEGSYQLLYPPNALLHRLSPFTDSGLMTAFGAGAAAWEYKTWPQVVADSDLPQAVKDALPIFVDGLAVWEAMHTFYSGFVDLYYEDDEAVQADGELVEYWKFELVPQYAAGGLPPLSKASLIDQMTHAVFAVTGYHEIVGQVVPYTTDPAGAALAVRPGQSMADTQTLIAMNGLVASTGTPMPKFLDDWTPILDATAWDGKRNKATKILREAMVVRMKEVSVEIKQRNESRDHPYCELDPTEFECSVNL